MSLPDTLRVVIEAPPQPVAVLHQAKPAPALRGARKPMKRGGYRDSGADIALILRQAWGTA